MEIGDNIQKYRKLKGLTQKELAEKSGLATGTIQQYELKKRNPKFETLCKIANAMEIPVDFLIESVSIGPMTDDDVAVIKYMQENSNRSISIDHHRHIPSIINQNRNKDTTGTSYSVPRIAQFIANNFESEEFTEDELNYIKKFIEFVKSQRNEG